MSNMGLIHDLLWKSALWVFQDHLVLVTHDDAKRTKISHFNLKKEKYKWRFPEGYRLVHGLLHDVSPSLGKPWASLVVQEDNIFRILEVTVTLDETSGAHVVQSIFSSNESPGRTYRFHATQPWRGVLLDVDETRGVLQTSVLPSKKLKGCCTARGEFSAGNTPDVLRYKTFELSEMSYGSFTSPTKPSLRTLGIGPGYEVVDIHPTRGDLVLLRSGNEYSLISVSNYEWSWEIETTLDKPMWTRFWYRRPLLSRCLHPFEFWDGTTFALNRRYVPIKFVPARRYRLWSSWDPENSEESSESLEFLEDEEDLVITKIQRISIVR